MPEDLRHQIFQTLHAHPDIKQRELASRLGISLGKVNYCLQALISKGWVKARNFKNSKNKLAYAYFITPVGIEEKARLTFRYLKRKLREHDELVRVIDELKNEVRSEGQGVSAESEELRSELDRFDASLGRANGAG
ncbi:MAG: MarR family EPS-associated transcriptional regulator [Leptospiraceae bacterium]|nr:MarR family EPS-associated transcriptional regulator [Leptospiraceae bacterium]MCP5484910.1 MarR family EPS-associated transcriptional regulator [Spirochaetales bacterium]